LTLTFLKEVSEKLQGEKNLECSPSFDKLRTVSKVEPLGEPCKGSLSFPPAAAGDTEDKMFQCPPKAGHSSKTFTPLTFSKLS